MELTVTNPILLFCIEHKVTLGLTEWQFLNTVGGVGAERVDVAVAVLAEICLALEAVELGNADAAFFAGRLVWLNILELGVHFQETGEHVVLFAADDLNVRERLSADAAAIVRLNMLLQTVRTDKWETAVQ